MPENSSVTRKVAATAALGLALAAGTASVASASPSGSAKVEKIGSAASRVQPKASANDSLVIAFQTVL